MPKRYPITMVISFIAFYNSILAFGKMQIMPKQSNQLSYIRMLDI